MVPFLRNRARPWNWSWQAKLVLLVSVGVALWAGRHISAWRQRRAAVVALERYHAEDARRRLDTYLARHPDDATAQLLASRAARRLGDFAAAEQHLRASERLQPSANEVVLEWSLLRATTGDIDEKVEDFLLNLAQKEPGLAPLIWEALTEGYTRVYRVREAFVCAERWLLQQPNNVQALYLRGNIHRHIRNLQKGVPDYQRVVELDPTRADARKWLAVGLVEAGRYADALPHLDMLHRETPADADIVIQQARAWKGLGQAQRARTLLDGLLAEQPEHSLALRVRGEVDLGDHPAEAEAWLRKAARVAPFEYQTQFLLLQSLIQQGKEAETKTLRVAVDRLKEQVERLGDLMSSKMSVRPYDPALHVEMGKLLIGLGQHEIGKTWLHSALLKDSDYAPAHEALAEVYDRAGEADKASFHRQKRLK